MIYIALIDDEINTLNTIYTLVENYYSSANLQAKIYKYTNPFSLLKNASNFDIVLLDIDLPDLNGIELAKRIRNINLECCICFITNYNKFASESYSVHAFDFIEKPIDKIKITKLFDDIRTYNVYKMISKNNLVFKVNKKTISIQTSKIQYFEYFDKGFDFFNRSTVLYTDKDKIVLHKKISDVYNELPSDIFVVPHKSFIVNLLNVKCIKNNIIVMNNNDEVPLSQKRASKFRRAFNEFIKKYLIS